MSTAWNGGCMSFTFSVFFIILIRLILFEKLYGGLILLLSLTIIAQLSKLNTERLMLMPHRDSYGISLSCLEQLNFEAVSPSSIIVLLCLSFNVIQHGIQLVQDLFKTQEKLMSLIFISHYEPVFLHSFHLSCPSFLVFVHSRFTSLTSLSSSKE